MTEPFLSEMIVKYFYHIVTAVLLVSMIACSGPKDLSQISNVSASYEEEPVSPYYTNPRSDLVFSFKISKASMSDTLNAILDSMLVDAIDFDEYDVTVAMKRVDLSTIKMIDRSMQISVPLDVVIFKQSMFGTLTANGTLKLDFESDLNIDPNWNLITYTSLEDYSWIEKPKFSAGLISIPITTLTNTIIDKSKHLLTRGIDEGLKENFSMRTYVDEITDLLLTPYQLDSTFGGWIYMMADSTYLAPAQDEYNYSSSKFYAPMYMKVQSSYPYDINNDNIAPPIFSWKRDIPESTTFRVRVDLTYDYLTSLAKKNFQNQTFKNGGKEVTIEDLVIYGEDNLLKVACKTSGSFNGNIIIGGRPHYDDNILQAKNLELDVSTKNIFHKTGSWLAKGYIRNQLDKMLYFDITEYLEQAKDEIELKLSELKKDKNITIDIDWGEIDINSIQIKNNRLDGLMEASLKVDIVVDDLNKLSTF